MVKRQVERQQAMQQLPKGIYIMNGQKVVIR